MNNRSSRNLSTFSSHMTNIVSILNQVIPPPWSFWMSWSWNRSSRGGAGLAIAILEDLRLRGIKTMATTHYPELKAYGIETAGVQNASMEFDTASLRPTIASLEFLAAQCLWNCPPFGLVWEHYPGCHEDTNTDVMLIKLLKNWSADLRKS